MRSLVERWRSLPRWKRARIRLAAMLAAALILILTGDWRHPVAFAAGILFCLFLPINLNGDTAMQNLINKWRGMNRGDRLFVGCVAAIIAAWVLIAITLAIYGAATGATP